MTAVTMLEDQRSRLESQTMQLGIASGATLVAITVTFVPLQLLVGMLIFFTMMIGLLYTLYQRAMLEYQNVVTGRGLGDYLPPNLYDQLANISFHDWMVNGTWIQDHQQYALYFIPGLTNEQLNAYVERLQPRHRRELRQPGLGRFFGSQFMRLLMGDQRLQLQQQAQRGIVPRRLELEHTTPRASNATDVDDEASELGNDDDPAAQYVRFFGMEPENSTPPSAEAPVLEALRSSGFDLSIDSDHASEEEEEEEEEGDSALNSSVVTDAVLGGMTSYYRMGLNFALGYTRNTATWLTSGVLRTTLTLGLASVGIGALGVWAGVFEPPRSLPRMAMPRFSMESQTMLMGPVFASAGAMGGMSLMMFGFPGSSTASNENDGGKQGKTKKA